MSVIVRLKRMELSDQPDILTIEDATAYFIHDDHTLELRKTTGPGKYRVMGHVNAHAWELVRLGAKDV